MYYKESGSLMTDTPSIDNLESIIRIAASDGTLLVNDIFILQGYVLCFCYSVANNAYSFYQFLLTDLTNAILVNSGAIFGTGTDRLPYVYTDGTFLYVTNSANNSANDYAISKLNYSGSGATITANSTINLDVTFVKTSNAVVVVSDKLVTLTGGILNSFNLLSGVKTTLGTYNSLIGNLFKFNGSPYFTSGEVAKKWTL